MKIILPEYFTWLAIIIGVALLSAIIGSLTGIPTWIPMIAGLAFHAARTRRSRHAPKVFTKKSA